MKVESEYMNEYLSNVYKSIHFVFRLRDDYRAVVTTSQKAYA